MIPRHLRARLRRWAIESFGEEFIVPEAAAKSVHAAIEEWERDARLAGIL